MDELMRFVSEDGVRLALAILLGGVIGLEREASEKPAGLRTNILICVGSTLMMILSIQVAKHYAVTAADPGRIAQGVITGIGFLGAGTILHSRGGVTGLTTAATTWTVAGIGLALGSGFYLLAITTTLLILGVLLVLGRVSHVWPNGKGGHATVRIVSDGAIAHFDDISRLLDHEGIPIVSWSYRRLNDAHSLVVECGVPRESIAPLLTRILAAPGIRSAKIL